MIINDNEIRRRLSVDTETYVYFNGRHEQRDLRRSKANEKVFS